MLANGRSTGVEQRRLTEKNERPVGNETPLRFDNLFKRAANVNGRSPRAFRSSPGNRRTQSIVDLEGAGAVTETLQLHAVMRGQVRACDAEKLSGSDAGENEISFRELRNFMIGFNTAAKTFQIPSKGICGRLVFGRHERGVGLFLGMRDSWRLGVEEVDKVFAEEQIKRPIQGNSNLLLKARQFT